MALHVKSLLASIVQLVESKTMEQQPLDTKIIPKLRAKDSDQLQAKAFVLQLYVVKQSFHLKKKINK